MKPAICSSSLFHLPLSDVIDEAAKLDVAVEIACGTPHLTREDALRKAPQLSSDFADMGVPVSALAAKTRLTDDSPRRIEEALDYINACSAFGTKVFKLAPGGPSSKRATEQHYSNISDALESLALPAERRGVRLAVEVGPNRITDTRTAVERILEDAPDDIVGLDINVCDLTLTCRDDPVPVLEALTGHTYHITATDGLASGEWTALGEGLVDWPRCLSALSLYGYRGYVAIESPGTTPRNALRAVSRDLAAMRRLLDELQANV